MPTSGQLKAGIALQLFILCVAVVAVWEFGKFIFRLIF